MTPAELRTLLDAVSEGRLLPDAAHTQLLAELRDRPFEDLGFARVDHHRAIRQGFPEVILGLGKTAEQISAIALRLTERGGPLLVTRIDATTAAQVQSAIPAAVYHEAARALTVKRDLPRGHGVIVIASAG